MPNNETTEILIAGDRLEDIVRMVLENEEIHHPELAKELRDAADEWARLATGRACGRPDEACDCPPGYCAHPIESQSTEAGERDDDVEVSERMIRWGVKELTHALDRGDITLGQAVAAIYRTMERVRRRDAENGK